MAILNLLLLMICAHSQLAVALMTVSEFRDGDLSQCYEDRMDSRISRENINGQELPLPSAMETFVSLVERLETRRPTLQAPELIRNLLKSLRINDLHSVLSNNDLARGISKVLNDFHRAFLNLPLDDLRDVFKEDDFTKDERCALHFMLSHAINDTRRQKDDPAEDTSIAKYPREQGVVSLHAKWKHAFALDRVLLGLLAGLSGGNQMDAADISQRLGQTNIDKIRGLKVNRIFAVTIADLVTAFLSEKETSFAGDGRWNDPSCTTEYKLEEYKGQYLSHSLLRGAVDGLILGLKVDEKPELYRKLKVSQILRSYYGYGGLPDDQERANWCIRERLLPGVPQLRDEILNYNRLYKNVNRGLVAENADREIQRVLDMIQSSIFTGIADESSEECRETEVKAGPECAKWTILPIIDSKATDNIKNLQVEVIGNLSVSFNMRYGGNSMGVYSNMKPLQQNMLDTIINQTDISGCPSCFARYYSKSGGAEDVAEVWRDLNQTLTDHEKYLEQENADAETKTGWPARVVLFFSYASPNDDRRLKDAVWEIQRYFREVTILAVGREKQALEVFVEDKDNDIFTDSTNVGNLAKKLKQRICRTPAEFTFRQCYQSSRGSEADNRQEAYVPFRETHLWAMYPRYFHRSFGIKLKFKAQEGSQIKVCFSRYYQQITEERSSSDLECKDSSGEEIEFRTSNPCHRRTVHDCRPFYFSVEGKKAPVTYCESTRCTTPKDIQFEFQHEGISCNMASVVYTSQLALLFAAIMYFLQK